MPGSVASATATVVLPYFLCTAFSRSERWKSFANGYANGEHEAASLVTNSRRSWDLNASLPAGYLAAMRDFFDARLGQTQGFFFYDPHEGAYDATGVSSAGRYIVRFAGSWSHTQQPGRLPAALALIEIL